MKKMHNKQRWKVTISGIQAARPVLFETRWLGVPASQN